MDVSNILASHAAKLYDVFFFRFAQSLLTAFPSQSVTVEKETPLDVDTGFLTVTDLTPIDEDSYKYDQLLVSLHGTTINIFLSDQILKSTYR
jgi:regulator of ribosome biosynthesis